MSEVPLYRQAPAAPSARPEGQWLQCQANGSNVAACPIEGQHPRSGMEHPPSREHRERQGVPTIQHASSSAKASLASAFLRVPAFFQRVPFIQGGGSVCRAFRFF